LVVPLCALFLASPYAFFLPFSRLVVVSCSVIGFVAPSLLARFSAYFAASTTDCPLVLRRLYYLASFCFLFLAAFSASCPTALVRWRGSAALVFAFYCPSVLSSRSCAASFVMSPFFVAVPWIPFPFTPPCCSVAFFVLALCSCFPLQAAYGFLLFLPCLLAPFAFWLSGVGFVFSHRLGFPGFFARAAVS